MPKTLGIPLFDASLFVSVEFKGGTKETLGIMGICRNKYPA
jgi:hypothetical protein